MLKNKQITAQRVRELLDCDPMTGIMRWKIKRPGPTGGIGSIAGVRMRGGYWRICVDHVRYRRHNLVWLHIKGVWPKKILDHKDQNTENDAIANLREATHAQNQQNNRRKGASGLKGVSFHKASRRFRARITLDGETRSLGCFDSKTEAHEAYIAAAKELFGEFACAG